MKVAEIMTTEVVTVPPSSSLKEAAELMLEKRISGMPVVGSDREVLGIVSETDVLFKERIRKEQHGPGLIRRHLETEADTSLKLAARTVGGAMTTPPVTIGASRSVAEAATLMLEHSVNRLPVVDTEGHLVGLVTRTDLVRAFTRTDDEIERELREQTLLKDLWLDPDSFKISVIRGEVQIEGEVDTEQDAELVRRWAALVPGVVSVDARLRVVAD